MRHKQSKLLSVPRKFLVKDPRGKEVILTEACWVEHILAEHGELAPYLEYVEQTITDPDRIYKSQWDNASELYLRRSAIATGSFQGYHIVVIVRWCLESLRLIGVVTTGYVTSDDKIGGELRWQRSNQ